MSGSLKKVGSCSESIFRRKSAFLFVLLQVGSAPDPDDSPGDGGNNDGGDDDDNDEPNARLAGHIWEDNGLDVPEGFTSELLPLLGELRVFLLLRLIQ